MIHKKIEYITEKIPTIENTLKALKGQISEMLTTEERLAEKLKKSNATDELQNMVSKLNENFERKGKLEEQKRLLDSSAKKIAETEKELDEINNGIHSKEELMKNRIAEFNRYFSALSSRLYGESFVLSQTKNVRGYGLTINSVMGNPGTGMKKGEIAAFDLSYIQFADEFNIPCLHFVLQDQIENVHDNQISSLLTEIVSEINCQYVLPVLKDKLPNDINIDQYKILSLSQSDKLFKLG